MFVKAIYKGYHPLGGDLEIDGIKIMQHEWKELRRPLIFAFGKPVQGISPMFSDVFVAEENQKSVFFLANESGIGKYHIWCFSTKAVEKMNKYKKKTQKQTHNLSS